MSRFRIAAAGIILSVLFSLPVKAFTGEVISITLENSVIYPGTERIVEIYVPTAYDGVTPACLLVCMDGGTGIMAEVLDSLIAEGSIPVTIGVIVTPGRIYDKDERVVRYNRSNEYDRMDGRFAGFIETEVLPRVENLSTADGRRIRLSGKAADRAIMGTSSGGICAFNAAWQRPDLFSRVYCFIGTFVSFRGGDQFPALVRKGEPRRLRVYLQDNMDDTWNPLFGSWFEYNRIMLSALEFAGYEVRHQWNEGGHDGRNGLILFPDAMRWLWSGWPEEVPLPKTSNQAIQSLMEPESGWKLVGEGISPESMLHPYTEEAVLLREGKDSWAVSEDGSRTRIKGKAVGADPYSAVYPGGSHMARRVEGSNWVWDYVLDENGQPSFGEEFYFLYADAGQILYDDGGYLYAATSVGIQVCDQNGRVRAILSLPGGKVSSIAYAGNNLFAISGGKLYIRKMKRSGTFSGAPDSEGEG
ncbi:MAG: hypothetical protein IJK96_01685 [Bacteroidales bacterium]|nr:hypothetical protein [Bacteroidales bacterium]